MYAWPKFHGSSPYSFRENDLNTKKFTPPTTPPPTTTTTPEKQYICLASASQARQKHVHFQARYCQTQSICRDWRKSVHKYMYLLSNGNYESNDGQTDRWINIDMKKVKTYHNFTVDKWWVIPYHYLFCSVLCKFLPQGSTSSQVFPLRVDPFLGTLYPPGKQTGSKKNCLPLKTWLKKMEGYPYTLKLMPFSSWNFFAFRNSAMDSVLLQIIIFLPNKNQ